MGLGQIACGTEVIDYARAETKRQAGMEHGRVAPICAACALCVVWSVELAQAPWLMS